MTKEIDLSPMFHPESIAIIGASRDKQKINYKPFEFLKKSNYQGEIYPVNPNYEEIEGYKCYYQIENMPDSVDLALIMINAKHVLTTLEKLRLKLIENVVVFSSGFSEIGKKGEYYQSQITNFAKEHKMMICGPNSLGIVNLDNKMNASFGIV